MVVLCRQCSQMHEGQQLVGVGSTDLKFQLAAFSRYFGSRPIAAITMEELDNWLRALPSSPKSRANFRANISVLFGCAMRRRMIDTNPILHTGRPPLPGNPPEIFTVDELRALLEAAAAQAPGRASARHWCVCRAQRCCSGP
jgi:site-specific recombinase XerD